MLKALRYLWQNHPWRTGLFALSLAAALFFAARLLIFSLYWADPAHRAQPIEGWMTPRYVAMSWDVPRDVVMDALGLAPEDQNGPVTLDALARDRGVPTSGLIDALDAAIAAHKALRP